MNKYLLIILFIFFILSCKTKTVYVRIATTPPPQFQVTNRQIKTNRDILKLNKDLFIHINKWEYWYYHNFIEKNTKAEDILSNMN